jgi:hypothetical protein
MTSLSRASTSIRRLHLKNGRKAHTKPMLAALTAAAPYLESLTLEGGSLPGLLAGARPALTSAARLTHLSLAEKMQVFASGGCLSGRAWAAAAVPSFVEEVMMLGPVTAIAAAAAPTAQLTRALGVRLEDRDDVADAINAFAAVAQQSLTRLDVFVPAGALPRLATLVHQLPSLAELVIDDFENGEHTVDLAAINNAPSLTRLAVIANGGMSDVTFCDEVAATVRDLTLRCLTSSAPPDISCPGTAKFTRLTRLAYDHCYNDGGLNLGLWGDSAAMHIPTLVELKVRACVFTLGGKSGEAWAAALAHVTLPRLATLRLHWYRKVNRDTFELEIRNVKYGCDGGSGMGVPYADSCPGCGASGECAGGRAVRHAVETLLPAAYAARNRELQVLTSRADDKDWWQGPKLAELRFEATPRP